MKKLIALALVAGGLVMAGPLKVATYPVAHPVKTSKGFATGVKATVVGLFKAGKAVLW